MALNVALDARSSSPPASSENTPEWVDATAVARHLGVARSLVYEHADELGARALGTGPKPRLRFRMSDVDAWLACSARRESEPVEKPADKPIRRRRRTRSLGTRAPLLAIKGRRPA